MAVRIIAVDDNQQFRELVKRYLNRDPEFSLVGEACDGQEGVRLTEELRPDLVLMDISMPRVNGLAATKEIKAARPETRVIILSVHKEEAYFRAAKEVGSDGYIVKGELTTTLLPTIRQVMAEGQARQAS